MDRGGNGLAHEPFDQKYVKENDYFLRQTPPRIQRNGVQWRALKATNANIAS